MKRTIWHNSAALRLLLVYLFVFSFFPYSGNAQHAYELKTTRDVPLLTAGAAGTVASILLRSRNKPLYVTDLGRLNASDIFAIDQSATTMFGRKERIASDVLLYTSYAFPAATLLLPEIRSEPLTVGIMLGEAILINEALTGITKAVINRPRPFTYNQDVPENIRTERENNFSFFSGHTSYAATLSFFSAKVITDNIETPAVKALVWTGAALWPAATGYMRYKAGMHFPTDVIAGYTVGAAVGYFIPLIHQSREKNSSTEDAVLRLSSLQVGPGCFQMTLNF